MQPITITLHFRGLNSVGQDEVVILLQVEEGEMVPPREVFTMLQALYEQAGAGNPVTEMGHIRSVLILKVHPNWMIDQFKIEWLTQLKKSTWTLSLPVES